MPALCRNYIQNLQTNIHFHEKSNVTWTNQGLGNHEQVQQLKCSVACILQMFGKFQVGWETLLSLENSIIWCFIDGYYRQCSKSLKKTCSIRYLGTQRHTARFYFDIQMIQWPHWGQCVVMAEDLSNTRRGKIKTLHYYTRSLKSHLDLFKNCPGLKLNGLHQRTAPHIRKKKRREHFHSEKQALKPVGCLCHVPHMFCCYWERGEAWLIWPYDRSLQNLTCKSTFQGVIAMSWITTQPLPCEKFERLLMKLWLSTKCIRV